MFPTNGEYVIAAGLFAAYFVLKWNLIPAISARVRPQTFLLCFFCGVVLLNLYIHHKKVEHGFGADLITPTDQSLHALNDALPPVQRVGFITDIKKSERSRWLRQYFITRYALAPHLVEDGTDAEWVVLNATHPDQESIPDSLVVVRDFGGGVMLLHRRAD